LPAGRLARAGGGGEASDSTQFETSLDIGPDIRPRIAVTDKGYDSVANRVSARARGITPVIPRRENSKQRGRFFPKHLYKLRARIETDRAKRPTPAMCTCNTSLRPAW
jgi:hypothetical protein